MEARPHPGMMFGSRVVRIVLGTVFVIGVALGTLLFLRAFLHTRRQLVPVMITPRMDFERATQPSLWAILMGMKDRALWKLHLARQEQPKAVAFTFDDGPYPLLTPELLDLLKRHQIRATFFVEGRDVEMQPELLRRIVADGHEIGNHSFTHSSFMDLDVAGITQELDRTDMLIRGLTGVKTRLMRPPGGRLDPGRMRQIQKMGYTAVFDNVNPGDWRVSDPMQLYTFTLWHSANRAIILLHSGRQGTIRALPTIIEAYRKKGYQFVTISELAKLQKIDLPAEGTQTAQRN